MVLRNLFRGLRKRESEPPSGFVIERGPERKREIATKELLSNLRTADHYQVGRLDARGQPIVLGREMEYLDYYGTYIWYIACQRTVGVDAKGVVILPGDTSGRVAAKREMRWIPVGVARDEIEALQKAWALAKEV
jgi:hypothetical protein